MGENYGLGAKVLLGSSGLFCLYLAVLVLFSHPLGFLVSGMIIGGWFQFLRLITFVFGSDVLMTYDGEPEVSVTESPRERAVRLSHLAKEVAQESGYYADEPGNRIIGSSHEESKPSNRVISASRTSQRPQESAERREDAEWADMFRSL